MALNLMLHCGSHMADRATVDAVPTPPNTETWFPIPHRELINIVESKMPDYGLSVLQQQHALMKDDHRYFGLYQVEPSDGLISADYSLVIGLRNSHDKSFPAGLCLGSGVFVCDNLAFSAEVIIGRRHTRYILDDLPRLVAAALGRLVTSRLDQQKRIDTYKDTDILDQQAAHLLFQAYDAKALTKTQLSAVWGEWNNPQHQEFMAQKNVWRLLNAITEVHKGLNPFELTARTQRLHPLLDLACGIQVGTKTADLDVNVEDAEFTIKGQDQLYPPIFGH